MTSWEFPTQEPIDLHIHIPAGKIAVTAMETGTANVTVDPCHRGHRGEDFLAATRVEFEARRAVRDRPREFRPARRQLARGDCRAPCRFIVPARHGLGGYPLPGRIGLARRPERKRRPSRRPGHRPTQVNSASGEVRLDDVADVEVETASGNVQIETAAGDISVVPPAGRVAVGSVATGRTDVSSASGDISVEVAPGIGVYLDVSTLSGTATNELDASTDDGDVTVTLRCRTISGDVRVGRAEPSATRKSGRARTTITNHNEDRRMSCTPTRWKYSPTSTPASCAGRAATGTAPRQARHPGGSRGSVRHRAGRTLVEVGLRLAGASADD